MIRAVAPVVGALLITLITGPHYGARMGVAGVVGLMLGFAMRARLRPAFVVIAYSLISSVLLYAFFWASIWLTAVSSASRMRSGRVGASAAWVAVPVPWT